MSILYNVHVRIELCRQQQLLTVRESAERKPVAPRARTNGCVRADHEVVVRGRLEALDHDEVVGGVRGPVDGWRPLLVVQHLIEDYLSIAVLPRRRVPLKANARRADADSREILRRTRWYWNHTAAAIPLTSNIRSNNNNNNDNSR